MGDYKRIIYKYNELGIPVYTYPMSLAKKDQLIIESINIPKIIHENKKLFLKLIYILRMMGKYCGNKN